MKELKQPAGRSAESAGFTSLLGSRERDVIAALRELGTATVQQVAEHLNCGLAYTTVMTTLDRLFRKGLVQRKKESRAFLYAATLSVRDIEGRRANHLVHRFFAETDARPEMLISCLVDAVHHYDAELLDQLESMIRTARARSAEYADGSDRPSPAAKEEP